MRPGCCTRVVGLRWIVFVWANHAHSQSNILLVHKSSKSHLWPSSLLKPNPNTCWRLWQMRWQLCRVTDCSVRVSGFLCAGLESVNVQLISCSDCLVMSQDSKDTKEEGRQRGTPHMDTMWVATPLLYHLGHVSDFISGNISSSKVN